MFKQTEELKGKLSALNEAGYFHYSTKTHQTKIDAAVKWSDENDARGEMTHLCEEFDEVIDFESRENAVEELGDLIFTALRYVNSQLEDSDKTISLAEVLEFNLLKLAYKKKNPKEPRPTAQHAIDALKSDLLVK